jgi:hypothetical protein
MLSANVALLQGGVGGAQLAFNVFTLLEEKDDTINFLAMG